LSGQTTVVFQPEDLAGGPFPNDALTVADHSTRTRIRVNLPPSAEFCRTNGNASVCSNTASLNQLDGFSVNPRVMVCFSGDVNPATLTNGIKLMSLNAPQNVVSLKQLLYRGDAQSHCAYAKPENVLEQQSRYLLVVTDAILDTDGHPVEDDGSFRDALNSSNSYYFSLASALNSLPNQLPLSGKIVSASLFTTMSATSWLEDVRNYVRRCAPGIVLPAGFPYQFRVSDLNSFTWQADKGNGTMSQSIPLSALSRTDSVGSVAFGLFLSPNYLNPSGPAAGTITTDGTKPVAIPSFLGGLSFGFVPVSFHVFLPSGQAPPGGWPVVIYGHGLGDDQFGAPTYIASTLAANGYATLALEITGHGYGAKSTVSLTTKRGQRFTVSTPGRGIQLSPDTPIGPSSGCIVPGAVAVRDCGRQTAVDLFALVKTIQQTNGLTVGLNPRRIYYVGQSFGAAYGTLFHAVEPSVKTAVLNAGGGSNVDVARLTFPGRQISTAYLFGLGLLNVPSAPSQAYFHDMFNDEYPYRDELTIDSVPGALAVQAAFEAADWLGMLGDPLAYAPHLKSSPLLGVPAKSTFFQYSWGDLEEPNPANSALIRAAGGEDSSWLFRSDWAARSHPEILGIVSPDFPLPIFPHRILSNPTIFDNDKAAEASIALAEQQATAAYFTSDGQTVPDPNQYLTPPFAGTPLFEQPALLPERLNFLQIRP
jgi:dienelactone hydrolase